jgi:hypothetical protein
MPVDQEPLVLSVHIRLVVLVAVLMGNLTATNSTASLYSMVSQLFNTSMPFRVGVVVRWQKPNSFQGELTHFVLQPREAEISEFLGNEIRIFGLAQFQLPEAALRLGKRWLSPVSVDDVVIQRVRTVKRKQVRPDYWVWESVALGRFSLSNSRKPPRQFELVPMEKEHAALEVVLRHRHAAKQVVDYLPSYGRRCLHHVKRSLKLEPSEPKEVLVSVRHLELIKVVGLVKHVEEGQLHWRCVSPPVDEQLTTFLLEHVGIRHV